MAKEYIDRAAPYKFMFNIPNPNGAGEIEVVSVDDLDSIPAADVVPVVRCEECEHWQRDWKPSGAENGTHFCAMVGLSTSADWFCADGERMDGGQDDGTA